MWLPILKSRPYNLPALRSRTSHITLMGPHVLQHQTGNKSFSLTGLVWAKTVLRMHIQERKMLMVVWLLSTSRTSNHQLGLNPSQSTHDNSPTSPRDRVSTAASGNWPDLHSQTRALPQAPASGSPPLNSTLLQTRKRSALSADSEGDLTRTVLPFR